MILEISTKVILDILLGHRRYNVLDINHRIEMSIPFKTDNSNNAVYKNKTRSGENKNSIMFWF